MNNEHEEQLRILKNLIMSDDFITQSDLQKVVKAMREDKTEERPCTKGAIETR